MLIEQSLFLATSINNVIASTQLKDILRCHTGLNVQAKIVPCVVYIYFQGDDMYKLFPLTIHIIIECGESLRPPYVFIDTFNQVLGFKFRYSAIGRPLNVDLYNVCQIYFDCIYAFSRVATFNCRVILFPHLHTLRHFYFRA